MYELYHHRFSNPGCTSCMPTGHGQAKKKTPLSKAEQRLEEILQAVPERSIIGFSIRYALDQGTDRDFSKLIAELKDHLNDTPKELEEVIGTEAIELLRMIS